MFFSMFYRFFIVLPLLGLFGHVIRVKIIFFRIRMVDGGDGQNCIILDLFGVLCVHVCVCVFLLRAHVYSCSVALHLIFNIKLFQCFTDYKWIQRYCIYRSLVTGIHWRTTWTSTWIYDKYRFVQNRETNFSTYIKTIFVFYHCLHW